jgi:hypothetical protein
MLLLANPNRQAVKVRDCLDRWPALLRKLFQAVLVKKILTMTSGVAIGSTMGHAISGFFGGGGGSSEAVESSPVNTSTDNYQQPRTCAEQVTSFQSCMNQNAGDLTICNWYLEQLKSCQSAASQY